MYGSTGNNFIPNCVHVIWLGSYPSNETLHGLQECQNANPNYEVTLWVDKDFLGDEEFNRLLNVAKTTTPPYKIKDIKEINEFDAFQKEFPIYDKMKQYELNRHHNPAPKDENRFIPNYFVPQSDMLRLWILKYQRGGHYIDDDKLGSAKFPDQCMAKSDLTMYVPNSKNLIASNSVLSATKDSKDLDRCLHMASSNYKLTQDNEYFKTLIGASMEGEKFNPHSQLQKSQAKHHYRYILANLAGPYAIAETLGRQDTENKITSFKDVVETVAKYNPDNPDNPDKPDDQRWGFLGRVLESETQNFNPINDSDKEKFSSPLTNYVGSGDKCRYDQVIQSNNSAIKKTLGST